MKLGRLGLTVLLLIILMGTRSFAFLPDVTPPPVNYEEASVGDKILDLKYELSLLLNQYSASTQADNAILDKVNSIIYQLDQSTAQKDLKSAIPAALTIYKPLIDAHDATQAPIMITVIEKLMIADSKAITRVISKDNMTQYSVDLLTELTYIKSGAALNNFTLDKLVHDVSGALSKSISTEVAVLNDLENGKRTFTIDSSRILATAPAMKTRLYLLEGAYRRYFGLYLTGRMPKQLTFVLEAPQNKYDIAITLQSGLTEVLKANVFENLSVTVNGTLVSMPVTELPSGQVGILNFRFSYDGDAKSTIDSTFAKTTYLTSFKAGQAVDITYTLNGVVKEIFNKPFALGFALKQFQFDEAVNPNELAIFKFNKILEKWEAVGGIYEPVTNTLTVNRMSLSQYTVLKSKMLFSDVKDDKAKLAVNKLLNKGIIKPDSAFNPNANITREAFVAWIAEAYGLDNRSTKNPFTDVGSTSTFKDDILAVYGQGIIGGKTPTLFYPKGAITKQEMAQIVSNAMVAYDHKAKSAGLSAKLFGSRTDIAAWSKDSVSLLLSLGLFTESDLKSLTSPMTKQNAAIFLSQINN
jgi:hypothetical protein